MARLDNEEWMNLVHCECRCMVEDGVLKAVDTNQVTAEGNQPIASTCTLKKKSDRTYREN